MDAGSALAEFVAVAIASVPIVVVLGTALVLAVGGIIGCARFALSALGVARSTAVRHDRHVFKHRLAS